MFALNKEIATKSGEVVKPFLVENKLVHCFDHSGRTIYKKLDDFNFSPQDENKFFPGGIKTVTPIKVIPKKESQIIGEEIRRPQIKKPQVEPSIETEIITAQPSTTFEVPSQPSIISSPKIKTDEKIKYSYMDVGTTGSINPYEPEIQKGGVKLIPVSEEEEITFENKDGVPGDYINNEDYI
jgi:hypothetical protein